MAGQDHLMPDRAARAGEPAPPTQRPDRPAQLPDSVLAPRSSRGLWLTCRLTGSCGWAPAESSPCSGQPETAT